jgi:GNAT superfamily N-acetyltransferase
MLPSERVVAAVRAAAESTLGRTVGDGTTIVADARRAGTGSASCFPTPGATIVWADPSVSERLAPLESARALSVHEFVGATETLGATPTGSGQWRVLDGALRPPVADTVELTMQHVGTDDLPPVPLLARLIDECDDPDVEEADLDLERLDPLMTLLLAPDAHVTVFAGGRPHGLLEDYHDIGVLTHPAWRRRGLGALAVHELVRGHLGCSWLYRCDVDNVVSARLADSLGFSLVTTTGTVSFSRG